MSMVPNRQDKYTYQDSIGDRINTIAQIASTSATIPADLKTLAYPSNRPGIQTFERRAELRYQISE